ncbi:unnamed protein product [Parnassius apollo]|uniref:(apollo) hypothetical protein n=1 Tax=Parnassius apollo TaxID=110799 RepID=A0A8S3WSM4_PARAO|nr:unnamed protein product [Parnassius apollo]CAG4974872.1 unnamed protein product [Parnassius apollo]CAG5005452.1 unnamed protein product [Parnassius apollo]CAG5059132.1 unnamed protein product [Parnassius apollo]
MAINLAQDIKTVSLQAVTRRATKEPQNSEQELPISKAFNAPLPLSWSKIMHIHFISSLPNIIKFQYDYLSDNEMAINLAQDIKTVSLQAVTRRATKEPQNSEQELPISKAFNAPLPLSTAKYKDLISLCNSNAIPTIYHDYFINLPHVKTILPNNITDSD